MIRSPHEWGDLDRIISVAGVWEADGVIKICRLKGDLDHEVRTGRQYCLRDSGEDGNDVRPEPCMKFDLFILCVMCGLSFRGCLGISAEGYVAKHGFRAFQCDIACFAKWSMLRWSALDAVFVTFGSGR